MKTYKQLYKKTIFVYIFSLWFLITSNSLGNKPSVEIIRAISYEEMPIVLNSIANNIRDNYERIVTWSGEIDVKIKWLWTNDKAQEIFQFTNAIGKKPKAILQKIEQRVSFVVDAKKNFVYVDKFREKNQYLNYITGMDMGRRSTSQIQSTSIGRLDFLLEAKPQSFKDGKIIHRKAVKKPSKLEPRTGLYENMDDPRRIFMPGGGYIWDHYDKLIKKINRFGKMEFDGYSLKMEEHKEGDIIVYKIIEPSIINPQRSSPDHYVIKTKIFSSQYGFNIIYWGITSGAGMPLQELTWEYELVNGVYLPKKVTEKHYRLDGEVAEEKDYTYINNKLNQKISSETFEYTNLNLKDGDIFIDEILNKEYQYKTATRTLKPVAKSVK